MGGKRTLGAVAHCGDKQSRVHPALEATTGSHGRVCRHQFRDFLYAPRLASAALGSVHAGLAGAPMALAMLELSAATDEGRRCAHRVART